MSKSDVISMESAYGVIFIECKGNEDFRTGNFKSSATIKMSNNDIMIDSLNLRVYT